MLSLLVLAIQVFHFDTVCTVAKGAAGKRILSLWSEAQTKRGLCDHPKSVSFGSGICAQLCAKSLNCPHQTEDHDLTIMSDVFASFNWTMAPRTTIE